MTRPPAHLSERRPAAAKPAILVGGAAALLLGGLVAARIVFWRGPVGNPSVPEPAKPVDLQRYLGRWYELARYENRFEEGVDHVSATYTLRQDGLVGVLNASLRDRDGRRKEARGRARIVEGARNAKLKVSFFGPFFVGDYWVLDHGDDYDWSIVGEPSGRFLWLLTREAVPDPSLRDALIERAKRLGYDPSLLRFTRQP